MKDQSRRILGNRNRTTRRVNNGPDSLVVTDKCYPILHQSVKPGTYAVSFSNFATSPDEEDLSIHTVIVPKSIEPPVRFKKVKCGGGKTIGGGTSREARRRARKKERGKK